MSIAQYLAAYQIADPVPKLEIASNTLENMPSLTTWSAMCWAFAYLPGEAYHDLIAYSDNDDVIGMGIWDSSGYKMNLGDLNSDNPGATNVNDNAWHHFAITVAAGGAQCYGWLDGRLEIGPVSLAAPNGAPYVIRVFNSRASTSDPGAVWRGGMCAVKIWDGIALNGAQIRREMGYYTPQLKTGVWAWNPALGVDTKAINFGGRAYTNWTVTGTWSADGPDPAGVSWDSSPTPTIMLGESTPAATPLPVFMNQYAMRWA